MSCPPTCCGPSIKLLLFSKTLQRVFLPLCAGDDLHIITNVLCLDEMTIDVNYYIKRSDALPIKPFLLGTKDILLRMNNHPNSLAQHPRNFPPVSFPDIVSLAESQQPAAPV